MAVRQEKLEKKKITAGDVVLFIVLILVAFTMVVPFAWMLSASFKNNN